MNQVLRCVARGCGFVLNATQQRRWESEQKGKKFGDGPFCSAECYHAGTKTKPGP